ncbi:MAG TPA: hypothetical protein VMZ27_01150, partial [Candidatus Saccharimonadales bacterium]|nr:hypothetical protein [Candidatus Saccharimonadales bacterium]
MYVKSRDVPSLISTLKTSIISALKIFSAACGALLVLFGAVLALQGADSKPPSLDAYRKYALTHEGDASRGAGLFLNDQKVGCARCHSIDGTASKAGPDLRSVGDAFGRRDIVESMLIPSATISPGYGTVIVETKAGSEYQGVLKRAS